MKEKSRVILLPCNTYDRETVYRQLKKGIELLGGIDSFVKKEDQILLKPNLLKKADVDQAVTTHPSVVGGVGRILREAGCGKIVLTDSCGMGNTEKNIRGTGMPEILEELDIPAKDFEKPVKVQNPKGTQAKEFMLSEELLEADTVISLAKMKTHALERITGAVKNSYGFIYGKYKALGHTIYPSADSFARMLIDLNRYVNPKLFILDGITAMEGNGPGSGDPIQMNVMLMSADPVALDTVFCALVDLDPQLVPTIYHGDRMGYGNGHAEKIEVITPEGEISMEEVTEKFGNKNFRVDRTRKKDWRWAQLERVFRPFQKKPYIDAGLCVKCGICIESCPVDGKALHFTGGRECPPVYDRKKCIRCFCCQEMCPAKAIKVK